MFSLSGKNYFPIKPREVVLSGIEFSIWNFQLLNPNPDSFFLCFFLKANPKKPFFLNSLKKITTVYYFIERFILSEKNEVIAFDFHSPFCRVRIYLFFFYAFDEYFFFFIIVDFNFLLRWFFLIFFLFG